jgi:hypothetical protein
MYLFARNRTCAPDRVAEATAFAVDIAAKVSSITGKELAVWQGVYGVPITSFGWTTTVDSYAEMGEAREKLMADSGYIETLEAAAHLFADAPEDVIADIVATAGEGGHQGEYSSIVMAQCAGGRIGEAMGWGVEMMNHVSSVTGRDNLFARSMHGPWASVAWFSLAASLEEVDAAAAALNADPDYLAKVDSSDGLFLPGSGESRLTRRIG